MKQSISKHLLEYIVTAVYVQIDLISWNENEITISNYSAYESNNNSDSRIKSVICWSCADINKSSKLFVLVTFT